MAAPPPDAADDATRAEIERLAADLAAAPADRAARPELAVLARRLEWLVERLIERGQLQPGHRRLLRKIGPLRSSVQLSVVADKRAVASPDVDCAALLPLCKARCCSFTVTLSRQDVEEGRLRWDLDQPYLLRKDPHTGYCANAARDGGCTAYHDRPATCRSYDCRADRRVWLDYDARIPAPMPQFVVPLGEWPLDGAGEPPADA